MNKSAKTGFQIITTFGTRIFVLFGSFIISVILTRLLGPEGRGIITAIFIIPNLVVSLADLGVRQATAFFVGRKLYSVEDILSSNLFIWLITSILSMGLVLVYFKINYVDEYGWVLVIIALLTIPIRILITYLTGIIQGIQKIGIINLKSLLSFFVNLLGVLIIVWLFNLGVVGAATVTLLVEIIALIYLFNFIRKIYKVKVKYVRPIPQKIIKKGITYALALFILSLNYRIDIIFLEQLTSASEIGIYSVGTSLAELIWQLPASISLVLFSKSASSKNDIEAHTRAVRILRLSLPILFIVCIIFALLSKYFITIIYGTDFQRSAEIINILLPGIFIITISKVLHPDMAARGYPLYGLYVFIGPLLINILLNILMIPKYGIIGAAWASTISYIIGGFLYGMVYAKKIGIKLSQLLILQKEDILLIRNLVLNIKNKTSK